MGINCVKLFDRLLIKRVPMIVTVKQQMNKTAKAAKKYYECGLNMQTVHLILRIINRLAQNKIKFTHIFVYATLSAMCIGEMNPCNCNCKQNKIVNYSYRGNNIKSGL